MTAKHIITAALIALMSIGCTAEFDDPTQAEVKKTEIIAITLDPPEAAPGDTVTASVHVADQLGNRNDLQAFWLLDATASMETMLGQTITFVVPELSDDAYDDTGTAALPVSVAVAKNAEAIDDLSAADFDHILESNNILFGTRTLAVSKRSQQTANPTVHSLSLNLPDGQQSSVTMSVSTSDTFGEQQQAAMVSPIQIFEDAEVEFHIDASPAIPSNQLRYQWISTAGDFKARRAATEPWIAPEYIVPADDININPSLPDVRQDPNLYPIWILVRDDGNPWQLGLTLVEFYVRVMPRP